MIDIEAGLTNIGEIAAIDIATNEKLSGLKENLKVVKRGGVVTKGVKDLYEKETKKSVIFAHTATDGRKYRIKQDKLYKSYFDLLIEKIDNEGENNGK